jgi:predicted enzyme related to lactoylglutathione lyase
MQQKDLRKGLISKLTIFLIPYNLINLKSSYIVMPTIVHFEIPSDDIERSKKFYGDLFGWNIEKVPADKLPEGVEYWGIATKDHEGNNAVAGGMMKRMMPEQQGILNYIDVKSIDEYSTKVEQLGGKIKQPKMAVPKMGYLALCTDTEGNAFGLWETDSTAK